MNILYWGTPEYSVSTLNKLHSSDHEIVGVVTQPDRRRGRGNKLIYSPVKAKALELGLQVFTPEHIKKDEECQKQLAELNADISVVVAFGQILPKVVLDQPSLGSWNGHASLLPQWRGAAPIQWSILEGNTESGVAIMSMEKGLDTGPILIERRIKIGLLENAHQLAERMSRLTADLMLEAMHLIEEGGSGTESERLLRLKVRKQTGKSSYARMLTKNDHQLNWTETALKVHRKVMGVYPNSLTSWNGKRLKILRCEPLIESLKLELSKEAISLVDKWSGYNHSPGLVLKIEQGLGLVVSTKDYPVLIREAQLEGKKRKEGDSLLQQLTIKAGDYIGT